MTLYSEAPSWRKPCRRQERVLTSEAVPALVQVVHSPYRGFLDCLRRTVAQDGIQALYKSYPTTVRARGCTIQLKCTVFPGSV